MIPFLEDYLNKIASAVQTSSMMVSSFASQWMEVQWERYRKTLEYMYGSTALWQGMFRDTVRWTLDMQQRTLENYQKMWTQRR